ncbi:MAG: RsmD family RNA methyltransferase [Candidatus Marinimicrobia bacterium]|nr:RsmD family RNA methyltransferase [Candidatus Neomarinimicrobiota bacterium]
MKINSGVFKNISLDIQKNSHFRPTTAICRKSIFDTICSLESKSFLDIFSGSGMIGFEAASRGAQRVSFVEMNKKYLNQIIENSKKLEYNNFTFLRRDAQRFIKKCDNYDIIFADPPYNIYDLNLFVQNALKKINKGGFLVVECSVKESLEGYDKIAKFGETNLAYWKV